MYDFSIITQRIRYPSSPDQAEWKLSAKAKQAMLCVLSRSLIHIVHFSSELWLVCPNPENTVVWDKIIIPQGQISKIWDNFSSFYEMETTVFIPNLFLEEYGINKWAFSYPNFPVQQIWDKSGCNRGRDHFIAMQNWHSRQLSIPWPLHFPKRDIRFADQLSRNK